VAREYYRIRIQLEPQPEGGWMITSPDVPGLVTEADTPQEIEANVRDAFQTLMESYEAPGTEMPASLRSVPTVPFTIETLVAAG
jgi:antitoxin HicB